MTETVLQKRRKFLREKYRNRALKRINVAVKELYNLGATQVYIFGSVLKPEIFDENSDIDIAVRGISDNIKPLALRQIEEIFREIPFDLIFLDEDIRPEIREKIEREGIIWKL